MKTIAILLLFGAILITRVSAQALPFSDCHMQVYLETLYPEIDPGISAYYDLEPDNIPLFAEYLMAFNGGIKNPSFSAIRSVKVNKDGEGNFIISNTVKRMNWFCHAKIKWEARVVKPGFKYNPNTKESDAWWDKFPLTTRWGEFVPNESSKEEEFDNWPWKDLNESTWYDIVPFKRVRHKKDVLGSGGSTRVLHASYKFKLKPVTTPQQLTAWSPDGPVLVGLPAHVTNNNGEEEWLYGKIFLRIKDLEILEGWPLEETEDHIEHISTDHLNRVYLFEYEYHPLWTPRDSD